MAENRMSSVVPWDIVSDGYVTEVVPTFEKWAADSIVRAALRPDDEVIDIATGPGTVALMLSARVRRVTALDFSPRMIAHLEREITRRSITNIATGVCDCQALPCPDSSFDAAFSQFGLMFFPDRMSGFKQMHRVLRPGGKALVYSWAPVAQSTAMTMMINALVAGFPEALPKENETSTIVSGLDNLETFGSEMAQAGFAKVTFEAIRHDYPLLPPVAFWQSMVRGSAPVTLMKSRVPEAEWKQKEKASIAYLEKHLPETALSSTAYLGMGTKPA